LDTDLLHISLQQDSRPTCSIVAQYGNGNSSEAIVEILSMVNLEQRLPT